MLALIPATLRQVLRMFSCALGLLLAAEAHAVAITPATASPQMPNTTRSGKKGWTLLGNGLAQLQNLEDPSAAFALGLSYSSDDVNAGFSIRRGSKTGTLTTAKDCGAFMLTPETADFSVDMQALFYIDQWGEDQYFGFYTRAGIGKSDWKLTVPDDGTELADTAVAYTTSLGLALQVFNLKTDENSGNDIALTLGAGLTGRVLGGDAGANERLRELALSSRQRVYVGADLVASLQINGIIINASAPVILGRAKGLTKGQFVIGLQLGGGIKIG